MTKEAIRARARVCVCERERESVSVCTHTFSLYVHPFHSILGRLGSALRLAAIVGVALDTTSIKNINCYISLRVDVSRFNKVLGSAIHHLESMSDLHVNAVILSRLIYRMKSKFRSDKGFLYMIKLEKALNNYHKMYLKNEYVTLKSHIQMEDGMFVLPSRQSLEYVLARTQGFGKLMTKIEEISKYTSHFLQSRMQLGHAWKIALMAFSTTCRIWYHSRNIIKRCCEWYDKLYQCAQQFQYVGAKPWLPNNQTLPCNLKLWLSLDWLETDTLHNYNSETWQKLIRKSVTNVCDDTITDEEIDSSNEETDDSRLTKVLKAASNNILEDNIKRKFLSYDDTDDIGEVVNREIFASSLSPTDRSVTTKRKHMDTDEKKSLKIKASKKIRKKE